MNTRLPHIAPEINSRFCIVGEATLDTTGGWSPALVVGLIVEDVKTGKQMIATDFALFPMRRAVMKTYPKGYLFRVPTEKELLQAGWTKHVSWTKHARSHFSFLKNGRKIAMLSQQLDFGGLILTVDFASPLYPEWYLVEDLHLAVGSARQWMWPVEACEEATGSVMAQPYSPAFPLDLRGAVTGEIVFDPIVVDLHTCTPGMTPLDGWVICKVCGKNLRKFSIYREPIA